MRILLSDIASQVRDAFAKDTSAQMSAAVTSAIKLGGDEFKARVRQNIASAGFSAKWQNAWRVDTFPKGGKQSMSGAIYGHHNIHYSGIFETGGTIGPSAAKFLWLPLPTVPKKLAGNRRPTPKLLIQAGVKLFKIGGATGGKPLLATKVRNSGRVPTKAAFSLSKLKRGVSGKRGELQTVPLFVGLPTVNMKRRFRVKELASEVGGQLSNLYFASLKGA